MEWNTNSSTNSSADSNAEEDFFQMLFATATILGFFCHWSERMAKKHRKGGFSKVCSGLML